MIGGEVLKKYLKKIGVDSYLNLEDDEKATYTEWEDTLSQDVTLDTLTDFMTEQLETLSKTLIEAVKKDDSRLALLTTAKIENYEALVAVIEIPKQEKEALIEHIETLLET